MTCLRRSRKGAWIEIGAIPRISYMQAVAPARERGLKSYLAKQEFIACLVAPARERGLKCNHAVPRLKNLSRSRKGAWIEI